MKNPSSQILILVKLLVLNKCLNGQGLYFKRFPKFEPSFRPLSAPLELMMYFNYGKPLFQSLTHGYDVNHVLLPPTVLYVFNQLLYTLQNSKKVPAYKNPLKVMGKINT